jgi:chromosome segregation ATPase
MKSTQKTLEETVQILQDTIKSRQELHDLYQTEVKEGELLQTDIEILEGSAYSLKSNFQEAKRELDDSKEVLDGYTTQLQNVSATIQAESSGPGHRLGGTNGRLYFRRQKRLISNACTALQSIHSKVPNLLRGQETKFLTQESWVTEECSLGWEAPIPATSYRA